MKLLGALLFAFVVAGCGCNCERDDVARLDEHLTLEAPVTVGNLTVWPVRTERPLDLGEFLTLEEALQEGVAEVREVGAPGGDAQVHVEEAQRDESAPEAASPQQALDEDVQTLEQLVQSLDLDAAVVNTLVVENKGDLPILVCAGTVVKGGKQDRQIGQDFVIQAKSTTPVDAFCVEQGRWQSDRLGAETAGKFEVLDGVATAKVRAKGQYEKDQGGVWQEVRILKHSTANYGNAAFWSRDDPEATIAVGEGVEVSQAAALESSSYAVAFDVNAAASAEDLKRCEDAVRKHFADHEGAVGFAYAINGKPVAVRTFAHPRLLAKQLKSFVRGMATEALLARPAEAPPAASAADVVALVKHISGAAEKVASTAALNRNGVRTSDAGFNGNCYVTDEAGRQVAITRDWTAK
jgi:hypothetical protein